MKTSKRIIALILAVVTAFSVMTFSSSALLFQGRRSSNSLLLNTLSIVGIIFKNVGYSIQDHYSGFVSSLYTAGQGMLGIAYDLWDMYGFNPWEMG